MTLIGINPLPSLYRSFSSCKRTSSDMSYVFPEENGDSLYARMPAPEVLAKRKARLALANRAEDALALFDEYAWDIIVKAHDEDMRSGGLQRIFPAADSAQYTAYFTEESYANLVLRKWYEAGGGDLFSRNAPHSPIPPWVPRQVSFSRC